MFSEDLLLAAMESAGVEDMPEDAERKGIGTPATRAESIEKLLSAGYVERKGKQILPTEKGYALIKVLPDDDLIKSPLLTAEWETSLKKVERGELSAENFMSTVSTYITTTIKNNAVVRDGGGALASDSNSAPKESVGKCPRCGGDVVEQAKSFSCSNYRTNSCSFALWKESKYPPLAKKKLSATNAKSLLSEGKVFMNGLQKKDGSGTYDAFLVLEDTIENGKPQTNYKLEFPPRK